MSLPTFYYDNTLKSILTSPTPGIASYPKTIKNYEEMQKLKREAILKEEVDHRRRCMIELNKKLVED